MTQPGTRLRRRRLRLSASPGMTPSEVPRGRLRVLVGPDQPAGNLGLPGSPMRGLCLTAGQPLSPTGGGESGVSFQPASGGHAPARRDSRATRSRLIRAVGTLLAERGATFGIPELASTAGTSLATAYRYFPSVPEALRAYEMQIIDDLTAALPPREHHGSLEYFEAVCARWADQALSWGPAYVYARSPQGILERLNAEDAMIVRLCNLLRPALEALAASGHIADINMDFGLLVWLTVFDERALLDMRDGLGLRSGQLAEVASQAVLDALRSPHPRMLVRRSSRGGR
jgi:AcrR family transcriptional regulator